jgi:hypothetical protein
MKKGLVENLLSMWSVKISSLNIHVGASPPHPPPTPNYLPCVNDRCRFFKLRVTTHIEHDTARQPGRKCGPTDWWDKSTFSPVRPPLKNHIESRYNKIWLNLAVWCDNLFNKGYSFCVCSRFAILIVLAALQSHKNTILKLVSFWNENTVKCHQV